MAVGLVVLVFAESWGSMRNMALAHGDALDANRELMVLGACNVSDAAQAQLKSAPDAAAIEGATAAD